MVYINPVDLRLQTKYDMVRLYKQSIFFALYITNMLSINSFKALLAHQFLFFIYRHRHLGQYFRPNY